MLSGAPMQARPFLFVSLYTLQLLRKYRCFAFRSRALASSPFRRPSLTLTRREVFSSPSSEDERRTARLRREARTG